MSAAAPSRLAFIEGMRGVAACQVLLLHYAAAFLPGLARIDGAPPGWQHSLGRSPLFALFDGYSAVYLFFVMSSFVLAASFLRTPRGFTAQAGKRLVRLYLPVAAAFVVGAVLLATLGWARAGAQAASGSAWLAALGHNPLTGAALARDGLLDAMLLGYRGTSIFDALAPGLALSPIALAVNAPTWTLHAEWWGSLLVLAVTLAYRRLPRVPFWIGFALLAMALGTSHFSLFLLGFVLYVHHAALLAWRGARAAATGALLFALGLAVCVSKQLPWLSAVDAAARAHGVYSAQSDFHWQSQCGAALLFVGALLCAPLRRGFGAAPARWLGTLSFSVYLLHFPILLSVGCLVFALVSAVATPLAAAAAALAVGAPLTFALAVGFERLADRRAVAWSRRLLTVSLPAAPRAGPLP